MFSFRQSYFRLGSYSIGYMLEQNFFFRYPGIGTVLHWRDTEMKNMLPTLPYIYVPQKILYICANMYKYAVQDLHRKHVHLE